MTTPVPTRFTDEELALIDELVDEGIASTRSAVIRRSVHHLADTVRRARIGTGVSGPGNALWVEATEVEDPPVNGRTLELAKEYKALVVGILQQRGAWQVIDSVERTLDKATP